MGCLYRPQASLLFHNYQPICRCRNWWKRILRCHIRHWVEHNIRQYRPWCRLYCPSSYSCLQGRVKSQDWKSISRRMVSVGFIVVSPQNLKYQEDVANTYKMPYILNQFHTTPHTLVQRERIPIKVDFEPLEGLDQFNHGQKRDKSPQRGRWRFIIRLLQIISESYLHLGLRGRFISC